MIAYHGSAEIKAHYVGRARAHRAADEIAHGVYYEQQSDGRMKMCAVGCTIHNSDHSVYERELGIPRAIARLEDRLFEGMANSAALDFPVRFLEAIPVGADLSLVVARFLHWLLVDERDGVLQYARPDGAAAIRTVAALYERVLAGETVSNGEWRTAVAAADAAYAAAAYAAAAAAYAAAAYAAAVAADAAYAAAAADAAADAADAAAAADAYAAAAAAALREKKAQAYERMADKLIALLTEAPHGAETGEVRS